VQPTSCTVLTAAGAVPATKWLAPIQIADTNQVKAVLSNDLEALGHFALVCSDQHLLQGAWMKIMARQILKGLHGLSKGYAFLLFRLHFLSTPTHNKV
jgi:hypothetical protein